MEMIVLIFIFKRVAKGHEEMRKIVLFLNVHEFIMENLMLHLCFTHLLSSGELKNVEEKKPAGFRKKRLALLYE